MGFHKGIGTYPNLGGTSKRNHPVFLTVSSIAVAVILVPAAVHPHPLQGAAVPLRPPDTSVRHARA